jgi:hypothetical protein
MVLSELERTLRQVFLGTYLRYKCVCANARKNNVVPSDGLKFINYPNYTLISQLSSMEDTSSQPATFYLTKWTPPPPPNLCYLRLWSEGSSVRNLTSKGLRWYPPIASVVVPTTPTCFRLVKPFSRSSTFSCLNSHIRQRSVWVDAPTYFPSSNRRAANKELFGCCRCPVYVNRFNVMPSGSRTSHWIPRSGYTDILDWATSQIT